MRTGTATLLIAGLALGFGSGWWARSLRDQEPAKRASREAALREAESEAREEARELRERLRSFEEAAAHEGHGSDASGGGAGHASLPEEAAETAGKTAGGDVENPMVKMFEAWRPMLETQVTQMAKGRATGISAAMELESDEGKLLADALGEEAKRQLDKAWEMFFGDAEIDPDALNVFQGMMLPDPSSELESALTAFMSDAEIADFRDEYKKEHEKQQEGMVDMTINMMGIPNLSDDQRTRLRSVFGGADPMREWNMNFIRLMREPEKVSALVSDPDKFAEEMIKGGAGQREQLRVILTEDQLQAAEKAQKSMIEIMRRQIEMFSPQPKKSK